MRQFDPRSSSDDRVKLDLSSGEVPRVCALEVAMFENWLTSYAVDAELRDQVMGEPCLICGLWSNGVERLRHARETQNYEDYIALKFFATSVNAVIDPEGGAPFDVQVTIDGRPLLPQESGGDIVVEDGRSFFRVDVARLYEVVALPEFFRK